MRRFVMIMAAALLVAPNLAPAESRLPVQPVWQRDVNRAWQIAQSRRKPVFLFIKTAGCAHCRHMEANTFSDERIVSRLERSFVPLAINEAQNAELVRKLGVHFYPTTVIIGLDGRVRDSVSGYLDADQLQARLERIQQGP